MACVHDRATKSILLYSQTLKYTETTRLFSFTHLVSLSRAPSQPSLPLTLARSIASSDSSPKPGSLRSAELWRFEQSGHCIPHCHRFRPKPKITNVESPNIRGGDKTLGIDAVHSIGRIDWRPCRLLFFNKLRRTVHVAGIDHSRGESVARAQLR